MIAVGLSIGGVWALSLGVAAWVGFDRGYAHARSLKAWGPD